MQKIIVALLINLFFTSAVTAQESSTYKNALGVRLGSSVPTVKSGITYKHFLANNNAIEGILSFGDGTAICALYEIHKPINSVENLQWFIGGGGYVGFNNSNNTIGAAGIVGLDYKFANIPLNLSLDWKPELNIVSKVGFEASGVGFSARFTF
ncbi:MAG: hypothetical protein KA319_07370 [Ferruginibacter sp.]|nr:hypothetical protein [Ferruginibacter sp.]